MGYEPETAKGYVRYRLDQAGKLEWMEKLAISGRQYTDPLLVDFNQDGNLDVVFTNWSQRQVGLWKGNGQGQLTAHRTEDVVDAGWKIYGWGDVTGDGVPDLVTHNNGGGRLVLLRGVLTPEACGRR